MKRGHKGLLLAAAGAAAVALVWALWREQSYEGKTLTAWLAIYREPGQDAREQERAIDAVRHIGSGNLPLLTRRLSYERPKWKGNPPRWLFRLANSPMGYPIRWLSQDSEGVRADQGVLAFEILGEEASPAIPALTNLLADWSRVDTCRRALQALAFTGTNGLAVVLDVVTNTASPSRFRVNAIYCLESVGRNGNFAIPTLIGCLDDRDVGGQSAICLGLLRLQPEIVVPALTKALRSKKPSTRASAARALAQFGPKAAAAVPELTLATTNADSDVRRAATNALRAIAPQVLTNAELEHGP